MNGREVELPAPPGYGRVVALDPLLHAGLGVDAARVRRFGRDQQLLLLTDSEFFQAALHYPIALLQPAGQELVPVAVLGMSPGRNLFADDDGRWEPDRYVPAVVRRYPFCVVRVGTGAAAGQRLIGVDRDALVASATPLFDAAGAPTARWRQQQELIDQFEGALETTARFCRRLEASALLEPVDVHLRRDDGRKFSVTGLQRVAEPKLAQLPPATAGAWLADGTLARIHAHLISLNHFPRFAGRCV